MCAGTDLGRPSGSVERSSTSVKQATNTRARAPAAQGRRTLPRSRAHTRACAHGCARRMWIVGYMAAFAGQTERQGGSQDMRTRPCPQIACVVVARCSYGPNVVMAQICGVADAYVVVARCSYGPNVVMAQILEGVAYVVMARCGYGPNVVMAQILEEVAAAVEQNPKSAERREWSKSRDGRKPWLQRPSLCRP